MEGKARLARGRGPTDSTADADAAVIDAQDQRFQERQQARLGLQPSSGIPNVDALVGRLSRLSTADLTALTSLDEADLALLLSVARRPVNPWRRGGQTVTSW